MINEARNAGCRCPESQYHHIRSKYLDDVTMRNTALNLKRASADASDEEAPPENVTRRMSAPPTLNGTPAVTIASPSKRKRKGHRRSVSWSKELQRELTPRRSLDSSLATPPAPQPRLSPRDEAAQILDEEDSPELKEIFL